MHQFQIPAVSAADGPWSGGHDGGVHGAAVPPGKTELKPTHSRSIAVGLRSRRLTANPSYRTLLAMRAVGHGACGLLPAGLPRCGGP
jgi:hypothetical protein